MSVTVNFECSGCYKVTTGTKPLRRHFRGVNGKSYGFGHYVYDGVEDVIPEGWLAFDPYTGCCYCPECWEEDAE